MKAQVNGITIDYRDEGAGAPVILIHAFPLNQKMWDDQVAALKDHCRVITLDLRGFGGSSVVEGPTSMSQMASDVRELMKALSIDRAVLVGLSMGGYVSMAFYREYPQAVRAIVFANTRATADAPEGRERRQKSAERAEREGSAAIADDMVPVALAPKTIDSRPDIVRRVRQMIESNSPFGLAAAQRAMAERLDSIELISRIAFPALVIAGADDKLTPLSEMESLRDLIPHSSFEVIQGAGHLSNLEQPDHFNRALINFIQSLKG